MFMFEMFLVEKFMVEKFMVEKFMVENFMAEKNMVEEFIVEKLMVENTGLMLQVENAGVEISCNLFFNCCFHLSQRYISGSVFVKYCKFFSQFFHLFIHFPP